MAKNPKKPTSKKKLAPKAQRDNWYAERMGERGTGFFTIRDSKGNIINGADKGG